MKRFVFIFGLTYSLLGYAIVSHESEFNTYKCRPYDQSGTSLGNSYTVISQNSATAASDMGSLQTVDADLKKRGGESRFRDKTHYFECSNLMNPSDSSSSKGMPVFKCRREVEYAHESNEPFEVRATNLNAALELLSALGTSESLWTPAPLGFKCSDGSKEVSTESLTPFYCRFGHGDKFDKQVYKVRSANLKSAISRIGALNGTGFRFQDSDDKDVECLKELPAEGSTSATKSVNGSKK